MGRWRSSKPALAEATKTLGSRATNADKEWSLRSVIQALQQKDQSLYPQDATAVGSDGISLDDNEVLNDFITAAWERLSAGRTELAEILTRALAYTSCSLEPFLQFLNEQLRTKRTYIRQPVITACGWCLRDPQEIRQFANVLLDRVMQNVATGQSHWWKALPYLNPERVRRSAS
jgi:hypothetical protein